MLCMVRVQLGRLRGVAVAASLVLPCTRHVVRRTRGGSRTPPSPLSIPPIRPSSTGTAAACGTAEEGAALARCTHTEHGGSGLHAFVASPLSATAQEPASMIPTPTPELRQEGQLHHRAVNPQSEGAVAPGSTDVSPAVACHGAMSREPSPAEVVRRGIAWLVDVGGPGAVNAGAGNGSTPLHWAAGCGSPVAVDALLAHGADPHARSYTWRCVQRWPGGRASS